MDHSAKKSSSSKITIIILAILLAVLGYYTYSNQQKNKESEAILLDEKLSIQSDLDKKIIELDDAIANNSSIENELTEARDNIIAFRDSVKDIKTLNYRIIRRYKNKLAVLGATNNKLLNLADSLKVVNYNISIERDSAQATVVRQASAIQVQSEENENLTGLNSDLNEKVNIGSALQIGNVAAIAMKERRSGELKQTFRASRTDAFRVSFNVRKNSIAEAGAKKAHVIIKDALGNVLSSTNTFTGSNGDNIQFTDSTDVEYNNEDIEVIVLTALTEEKLEKGNYYVSIYLEHDLLGTSEIYLK